MDYDKEPKPPIVTNREEAMETLDGSGKIDKYEGSIITRDALPKCIDEPCLPACVDLYDKNVRTVTSSGNIPYALKRPDRGMFIHIDYDSLSDDNKKIAYDLQAQGLVVINSTDTNAGLAKKVIVRSLPITKPGMRPVFDTDIPAFAKKCASIAEMFQPQDVYYGRYTSAEAVEQILASEGINVEDEQAVEKFLLQNEILDENDAINPGKIIELLSTKRDTVNVFGGPEVGWRTINFGKVYDEETGEFWANAELLQKHRDFIASGKTSTKSNFQPQKITI